MSKKKIIIFIIFIIFIILFFSLKEIVKQDETKAKGYLNRLVVAANSKLFMKYINENM